MAASLITPLAFSLMRTVKKMGFLVISTTFNHESSGKEVKRAGKGYNNIDKKAISRLLSILITNLGLMVFFHVTIYLK